MNKAKSNFEIAIKDSKRLLEIFDTMNSCGESPESLEVLKRSSLVMVLTAWETYVEDKIREQLSQSLFLLKNSTLAKIITEKLESSLWFFHNPNSKNTIKIFKEYLDLDISKYWEWSNYTSDDVKKKLDNWISKRGQTVHRAFVEKNETHIIKIEELRKCITFFEQLVENTESAFYQE